VKPNGCGAEGSILNPPDLRFKDVCDDHDVAYAMGGTSADRRLVDREWRRAMLAKAGQARLQASQAPWRQKPVKHAKAAGLWAAAWIYWGAVRVGGWRHWGKVKK
jgi:hypothetical protein